MYYANGIIFGKPTSFLHPHWLVCVIPCWHLHFEYPSNPLFRTVSSRKHFYRPYFFSVGYKVLVKCSFFPRHLWTCCIWFCNWLLLWVKDLLLFALCVMRENQVLNNFTFMRLWAKLSLSFGVTKPSKFPYDIRKQVW